MEINFPKLEKKILRYWKENKVFEKSIAKRQKAKDFIFYEGPPTVNAEPGIHHVLARIFKDIICRYKTMRGFRVLRKAGWDTHGLPIELEIEKKLGLKTKKDIEKYGVAKFNEQCRQSADFYIKKWEKVTERIAFWLDMEDPYITYDNDYIESVWWIIKQIYKKGLLYKDYKVVPYCPRCGTSLSSHEVAQGYERIKEPAIYIKFEVKNVGVLECWNVEKEQFQQAKQFNKRSDQTIPTYLLVWTTTPWTLPGNVAIAINPNFDYIKLKSGNEILILAKERKEILKIEGEILEEFKGKELIGLNYKPLYPTRELKRNLQIYKVLPADFVSLEEGTGLVHIAPAFGEEDMELIKMSNVKCQMSNLPKFPILLNVDEEGKFKPEVKQWAGMFVKEADPLIIEDLRKRNLLFKEEIYEHDYPFCWRCHSPLLYYAKESWFINMQKIKKDLIKNNQKINWIPAHLKEGRFGEWLREVKDWAISRERYWGTPLPIWKCKNCQNLEVIGSRKDLLSQKFSQNEYYILRHGATAHQTKKKRMIYDWPGLSSYPLTQKGKKEISRLAKKLKNKRIDLIYSSDSLRTRQTAEIIAKELNLEINFDKRLRDINLGIYQDKKKEEFRRDFPVSLERFYKKIPKGENWQEVKKRVMSFMKEIDKKCKGKRILIVSHGDPLWLLEGAMKGFTNQEFLKQNLKKTYIKVGELRKIKFKIFPYDKNGDLDFHRPFIEEVKFLCPKCQNLMEREREVIDCWFDSGAMPFGQAHWPFAWPQNQKSKIPEGKPSASYGAGKNQELKPPKLFPAEFISEAIDQTRGWFYTLLAISTLLGLESSFKNVISLGHVLDEKGEKMSKSKGNIVDPWCIVEKYGADATRWYFYTVNQAEDPKLFSEKDVAESLRKFVLTFWNCFSFFQTYVPKKLLITNCELPITSNVLDRWIVSRLNQLILKTTILLEKYDVTSAARSIEDFVINDLSLWYIRRSRKRFHPPVEPNSLRGKKTRKDFEEASRTLGFVLLTLSKLTAPFIPFLSEQIYQEICNSKFLTPKSIHLEDWPKVDKKWINEDLNQKMEKVREIVSLALAERVKASIRVRQPLASLKIKNQPPTKIWCGAKIKNNKELIDLIKEEINVKEVIFDERIEKEIELDTKITPGLKREGILREMIRNLQEMRKIAGYKPKDVISISVLGGEELKEMFLENREFILKETKARELKFGKVGKYKVEKEIILEGVKLRLAIKKVEPGILI
jgi:isoleucyl-tRNA synthetase